MSMNLYITGNPTLDGYLSFMNGRKSIHIQNTYADTTRKINFITPKIEIYDACILKWDIISGIESIKFVKLKSQVGEIIDDGLSFSLMPTLMNVEFKIGSNK